jgi:chorismate dehydratase
VKPKLGCVPFLNAKPLIAWFSESNTAEVVFENPSLLGPMVDRGEVDAAIASSFFAVQDTSLKIAAGVSISSIGPVKSVRLFSRVPFNKIESLALDSASMTSNHLARIILCESYSVLPNCESRRADLEKMLNEFEAAVLIGDAGMTADGNGLHVLDLGEAWAQLTGEPFVWAFWVGRDGLTEDLASQMKRAKDFGQRELQSISQSAATELGLSPQATLDYLTNAIDFNLTESHMRGYNLFGERCKSMGFANSFRMPDVVGEASAAAGAS